MNNKKLIQLIESGLHRIVKKSVNKVLNEIGNTEREQYVLSSVQAKADMKGLKCLKIGNYDEYQCYSDICDNVNKTSFKYNYAGDMDVNYDKCKDLYNAKQCGYRNYTSYMIEQKT